jgi:hypothetical protein
MRRHELLPDGSLPERERGRAAASPAPAAAVLDLQRSAGNQAVAAMLARETATTTSATTDPRLHYRKAGEADTAGLGTQSLPYTDPAAPMAGWDAPDVLNRLTQHDEDISTFTDEVRCAANATLAIAVLKGPQGVLDFAAKVVARAEQLEKTMQVPKGNSKSELDRMMTMLEQFGYTILVPIAMENIRLGFGKYHDLDTIANAAKCVMSVNPEKFSTGAEATNMARAAGPTTRIGQQVKDRADFETRMKALQPGESWIVNVDTDVLAADAKPAMEQGNHFVTVGREEAGGTPTYFLYDPYPRTGDQYMTSDSADFWVLFETADGHWKWVWIESLTKPAPAAQPKP